MGLARERGPRAEKEGDAGEVLAGLGCNIWAGRQNNTAVEINNIF